MNALLMLRRVAGLALVIAAILVWFLMAPDDLEPVSFGEEREEIASDHDLNNISAEGAPQQTVVNGWTSKDYLALLSVQLEDVAAQSPRDHRPAAFLLLLSLGLAMLLATSTRTPPADARRQNEFPVE